MRHPRAAIGVFLILLASDAFFWHARDWNVSSRLMLTYALVDRGTVAIDGLEDHTHDRAKVGGRYYSDKLPGLSLLAAPPYAAAKAAFKLPPHPLDRKGEGFTHWPADYWITLGTSGLATALCGGLLAAMAGVLGCGPRRSALVGLAYGLGTPAYVYATLAYGHQATAFFLLASFAAIERARLSPRAMSWASASGFAASAASAVELQVAPASAVIGLYLLGCLAAGRLPARTALGFTLGAAVPILTVLAYNVSAFGSPFDMGYFHEDLAQFQEVHSAANPLGLQGPDWGRAAALIGGQHRGLLAFAPILALAPLGAIALAIHRRWGTLFVAAGVCLAVFLVNLSYPEWTGGWSTGPRLLLPLLPFAMLMVAESLAVGGRAIAALAAALAIAGGVEMAVYQAVGGRIPPAPEGVAVATPYDRPFREVAWPIFRGAPLRDWPWKEGRRFDRNLVSEALPMGVDRLPQEWRWLQFAPLLLGQIVSIGALMAILGRREKLSLRA